MNSLQPPAILLPTSSPIMSNDVEMLQTDVMRFFAILCLCLMAIFALVKALPMAQSTDRSANSDAADLAQEARSLKHQIEALKKKLTEIRGQVQAASAAAQESSSRAQKTAANEQKLRVRLASTQQALLDASQSLERSRQDLKRHEVKLADLVDEISRKQRLQATLQTELNAERQKLDHMRAVLDQVKQKSNQTEQKTEVPVPSAAEKKLPQQSPKEGYILRFASDSALQKLISKGKVNFFAMTGRQTFRLGLNGDRPYYSAAPNPPQIYEMETATVPDEYVAAFKRQQSTVGRQTVTWGVTLPAQTKASIQRLMDGQKGGDLLIMPDGEVVLN